MVKGAPKINTGGGGSQLADEPSLVVYENPVKTQVSPGNGLTIN
jgi:hypothetical protein